MIVHDVAQNTPEWRELRAGIPTASQFKRIITPTAKDSSQREAYLFELLAERIMGSPIDDFPFTWAMQRGSALERKAVRYFEFQTDLVTRDGGFITDDLGRWGASIDRLIGTNSGLEVKAPELPTHMMYLMHEGSGYKEYRTQAQGELWVCELKELWFLSFHPDLPWSLVKVMRDNVFISQIELAVKRFSGELEQLSLRAKELGWFRRDSVREPKESMQDNLIRAMKESLIELKK